MCESTEPIPMVTDRAEIEATFAADAEVPEGQSLASWTARYKREPGFVLASFLNRAGQVRYAFEFENPAGAITICSSDDLKFRDRIERPEAELELAYQTWLSLGQNRELDRFSITRVAFAAGFEGSKK